MRNLNKNNYAASLLKASAAISIGLFLAACGDDNKNAGGTVEDQEVIAISDKTVSGVSQKGPFVNGSSVTVQELDGETLAQTGNSYEGKIKNDMGEFSVKVAKLASQYALLKANGFYRNEVSGEKSKSQVTLYALTDLSNRDEVNVNLLTHLEYERSLYLAADDSVTVSAAKKQAEREVLASFGIDGEFKSAEDLNIFGEDEGAAALLAISVLMQGDLNEADFSERLADYAADMETDGKWDDSKTATEIADWAAAKSLGQSLSYIREKITNWGLSVGVPAFEKYVDNFWWQNYGLGTCNKKSEGEVKKNENALSRNYSTYFICESGAWRVAYDTEYDTYQQKCDKDGKIVFGNVNKDYAYDCDVQRWRHASNVEAALGGCVEKRFDEVAETAGIHYICQNREWRTATNIEKDTYKWLETVKKAKDGDVRYGDVIKTNCYVFEDKAWRSGNATDCSLGLRGCTALRQDTVGLGSDNVWYKCSSKQWKQASEFEKDTAAWGAGKFDGEIRSGQINTSVYYIYETDKNAWRHATDLEKDTYDYKKNRVWAAGQDGDSKYGSVNTKNCYVFEDKTWRSGNETDCTLRLRGCTALRQDTVGKGTDKMWHICDAKSWRTATDIEKDTATWGTGEFDSEIRAGQVNKTIYYIYEIGNKAWRNATTLEKDTYDHENNKDWEDGVDGEIKKGALTDTIYVYDATDWRVADNIEKELGGCVTAIQDSVGKVGKTYYICSPRKWNIATETQYDTYKRECSQDGKMFNGNVNSTTKYVCDNSVFRVATELEVENDSTCTSVNQNDFYILPKVSQKKNYSYYKCTKNGWTFTTEKLNQGSLIDERDGHEYKTIGIKTQMWMAENLNYADSVNYPSMLGKNWCMNDPDSCALFGRLYTWSATIDSVYWAKLGKACGYVGVEYEEDKDNEEDDLAKCGLPEKVRGICPNGWHIPNSGDKEILYNATMWGGTELTVTGFAPYTYDKYGFSAVPAGYYSEGRFNKVGSFIGIWNSHEYNGNKARSFQIIRNDESHYSRSGATKMYYGISVRCIKDEE
jgi:uncharacterized protein (TIGR02145 family)